MVFGWYTTKFVFCGERFFFHNRNVIGFISYIYSAKINKPFMKQPLILSTLVCLLISATTFAQSQKKTSAAVKKGSAKEIVGQTHIIPKSSAHIGTWKLISQKVTYENGQMFMGDSTMVFQRKILTPKTFVVIIEKKVPDYDNKKLATSVAGGHYTLVNGNYEELTEYAAFKGFETMKVNYKLTIEDGKLHTVGTVGGSTIYDEVYIRED
jgi:hypothetical protein